MASLANVGERCPLDRPAGGACAGATTGSNSSYSPWTYAQKEGKPTSKKHGSATTKTGLPEALALLNAHPGINGVPLGSPSANTAAATTTTTTTAGGGAIGSAGNIDQVLANAFSGLKPLPELPQNSATKGRRGFRGRKRGKTAPRGGRGELGVPPAAGGSVRPLTAEAKAVVGGGREALARAGRELTLAGQMRPVGRVAGGDGGDGRKGALSTRLH